MSKPTIVMVPGAWHRPEIYTGVVEYLSQYGYPTVCLPLPSVGAEPPHEDFSGDVKGIRNCVTQLVSKDENVVLVVHSGTSLPGSEALKGLGKREREGNGLNGGVIRYVVMSGFAMPEGFQPAAKEDYSRFPEWMKMDHEKGIFTVSPEDAKKIFYNDLPSEKGDELVTQLLPQSAGVYFSMQTYAAWKDIPSTYIIGDKDQSHFSPALVDMMIKGAQEIEPSAFDVVEHCKEGGHCLMISYPEWTADVLRRAAGEVF